ncbi:MAG: hypothetical protein A2017_20795 [Lentisphaerae bacterium GWF2_44_16]|nr:MAG: hypothetical protein A2017_20795 [Lentisphaerae bacterium GWF2_44_16]
MLYLLKALLPVFAVLFFFSNSILSAEIFAHKKYHEDLTDHDDSLSAIEEFCQTYIEIASEKIDSLNKSKDVVEKNLHRLSFTMMSSLDILEFRLSYHQLDKEVSSFKADTETIRDFYNSVNRFLIHLDDMEKEIKFIQKKDCNEKTTAVTLNILSRIAAIRKSLEEHKLKLEAALKPANDIIAIMEEQMMKQDKLFNVSMHEYFFEADETLFSREFMAVLPFVLKHWFDGMGELIKKKLPDSKEEWRSFFIIYLLLMGLIFIPLIWALKLYLRKFRNFTFSSRKLIVLSAIYLCSALSLFIAISQVVFPESIIFNMIAVIFIARWGMDLAWALKNIHEENPGKSPISHLFWIYVASSAYQFINMPYQVLAVIWPGTLILGIIYSVRHLKRRLPKLEKHILIWTVLLLPFFLLLSIIGYVNLATLFTALWFMLAVAFQFSYTLSVFFKNYVGKLIASNNIIKTLVVGIGIPLIWVFVILSMLLWIGYQFLSIKMISSLLFKTFEFYGVSINAMFFISAVFLFFVFRTVLNIMRNTINSKYGNKDGSGGVLPVFHTLTEYAAWAFYAMIVMKMFGLSISSLAIVAGGLSVGIGIGLQGLVGSFLNGLTILLSRTIREGDIIQIDNMFGKVLKIDLRSTIIKTYDNAIVAVPNTYILNTKLINWTLNNKLVRRQIDIKIKAGSDAKIVKDLICSIALNSKGILKNPPPDLLLNNFTVDALNFTLYVWHDDIDNENTILSDLRFEINNALIREKLL